MGRCAATLAALCLATPAMGQESEQFGEELEVHLVTVRVHVSTATGKGILNLDPDAFEVTEDGKPVEMVRVERPEDPRLRVAPVPGRSTAADGEVRGQPFGDLSRKAESAPARVMLVFDSSAMLWPAATRALRRMQAFVRDRDYSGVEWSVALTNPEASFVVTPFTNDATEVSEGLSVVRDLLKGQSTTLWTTASFAQAYDDQAPLTEGYEADEASSLEGDGSGAEDSTGSAIVDQAEMRLAHRKRQATAHALASLIQGIAADGDDETATWLFHGAVRPPSPGRMSADILLGVGKVHRAWDVAANAASSAGVPIYTINVRGLDRPTLVTSYRPHTAPMYGGLVDVMPQELAKTISAQTGGRYIELNHVTPAAELAFKEYGEAYEITYQVDRAPDGKEHKVEVKVPDHPFATLRYPRRYFDWSARERLVRALNTSAGIPKSGGSLPVEVVVNRNDTEDGEWKLTVGARTPTDGLGLVEDPDTGEKNGRAEWFVALYGEDGLLDELDSQTLTVDAAEEDSIAGFDLTVAPGEYTVAVAVLDAIDRKSGMAFTRVMGDGGDEGDDGDDGDG